LLTIAKLNGLKVELVPTATGKDVTQQYIDEHQPMGKVYFSMSMYLADLVVDSRI
jgi:hypothetical protein